MGISGLLPLLKSIHRHAELKQFAGETLGVDGYGWLHRGAIGCAIELAEGKPSRKYVDFAMHRVRMMKHFGVTPYLVFDGDFLPSKAGTEASRAKRREESTKAGLELLRAGKASQAHLELQKAIDVSPEMARHLIEELKKAGVPYVVAPYEADAQLVYLERIGLVSGIISEDSDLLVFGAKRLLTKMDQYGRCVEINRRDFCAVREVSLTGWTDTEFRHMAILSGCDYLKGLENMGLKTAYRMIRKYKTPERVIKMIQFNGKHRVPANYLADFQQADLTFLHQRVFCPKKQELSFLTEPDSSQDISSMPFIGAFVDVDLVRRIAAGEVNPITKAAIEIQPSPGKRRSSQVTGITASAPPQRASGKPIDAYFQKGYSRIPLAEMEPNCFVVNPNQIITSPTPAPLLLPRPYLDEHASTNETQPYMRPARWRTEPITSLLSSFDPNASNLARRTTTVFGGSNLESPRSVSTASHGTGPLARPSKKPRLCEDQLQNEDSQTDQRSKFFPIKHDKGAAQKKPTPFLMSEDSVEEALQDLPDVDGWASSRKSRTTDKIEIFADSPEKKATGHRPSVFGDDEVVLNSDIEIPASPVSELKSEKELPSNDLIRGSPERSQAFSIQQFSYRAATDSAQPARKDKTVMAHGMPTPATSVRQQPNAFLHGNLTPATSNQKHTPLFRTPRSTPLQRIGARAMQSRTLMKGSSPASSRIAASDRTRQLLSKIPVDPASIPLPKVDVEEVQALSANCYGSEDQIIPDSDTENDVESQDTERNGSSTQKLPSLKQRFAYQGSSIDGYIRGVSNV